MTHWQEPLPQEGRSPVTLRPIRKHRVPPSGRWQGSLLPQREAVTYIFLTVREGLSLICFKWQFL